MNKEPEILDRCSNTESDCLHCVVSRVVADWMFKHPDFNAFILLADISQVISEMIAGLISEKTQDRFLLDLNERIRNLVSQMSDNDEHQKSIAIVKTFVESKKPKKAH